MNDGKVFEGHCKAAISTPENPMTDQHITDKTRLQMEIVYDKAKAKRLVDECWAIPSLADVGTFVEGLAA